MKVRQDRKIPVFVKHYAPGAKYEVCMSYVPKVIANIKVDNRQTNKQTDKQTDRTKTIWIKTIKKKPCVCETLCPRGQM